MGAVYFIQEGRSGPVKIGFTSNASGVKQRVQGCQTGNPRRLSLQRTVVFADAYDARDAEGRLHKHFRKVRMEGEWFDTTTSHELRGLVAGENIALYRCYMAPQNETDTLWELRPEPRRGRRMDARARWRQEWEDSEEGRVELGLSEEASWR